MNNVSEENNNKKFYLPTCFCFTISAERVDMTNTLGHDKSNFRGLIREKA